MPSQIGVNSIQSYDPPNIAPILSNGLTVASGYALTCSGGINIVGVVTATSFSGDGSAITNLPLATIGTAIGQSIIFG
jgi:hypothetical protein